MSQVTLVADGRTAVGGTTIVMHNERLVDPLDPFVQEIAKHTGKRGNNKTLQTHAEISRLEFYASMYTEPALDLTDVNGKGPIKSVVTVPSANIIRCLQQAASQVDKKGQHVLRGVHELADFAVLEYDHQPTDLLDLYKDDERFLLRKSVGVQRSRTMRSRAMFTEWTCSLDIEVDEVVFNLGTIENIWGYAGRYVGLCEMRPRFGRFEGRAVQTPKAAAA